MGIAAVTPRRATSDPDSGTRVVYYGLDLIHFNDCQVAKTGASRPSAFNRTMD
jgi:hypothetical protein